MDPSDIHSGCHGHQGEGAVSERKAFLELLAQNEDDTTTRLVYADWLDDHGEHEEADRQRKWPAAKEWLVRFCEAHNPRDDDEVWIISYEMLLELGQEAVERERADGEEILFRCSNNITMCHALGSNSREFWRNWSIVTGIPVSQDVADKSDFSCAC
jgi:uncharacterized protein (TIGR02996 family)